MSQEVDPGPSGDRAEPDQLLRPPGTQWDELPQDLDFYNQAMKVNQINHQKAAPETEEKPLLLAIQPRVIEQEQEQDQLVPSAQKPETKAGNNTVSQSENSKDSGLAPLGAANCQRSQIGRGIRRAPEEVAAIRYLMACPWALWEDDPYEEEDAASSEDTIYYPDSEEEQEASQTFSERRTCHVRRSLDFRHLEPLYYSASDYDREE